MMSKKKKHVKRVGGWLKRLIGTLLLVGGLWFFLLPGLTVFWYLLTDEGLHGKGVSSFALSRHKALSDDYARYARERIASGKAETLTIDQIAETEWPLFGSCFYLWATESLQEAWEKDPSISKKAPKDYARQAIDAAKDLVLDRGHSKWVRDHWGEAYLQKENVFYRMLVISAIVSHHNLTGSEEHFDLLRDQSDRLMNEIDASFYGILDDYPGQCYPADVAAAIAAIQKADQVLGTDHGGMIRRSIRGFTGDTAGFYGLPAYAADSVSGQRLDESRGCGNSYFTTFAPVVWAQDDPGWYQSYVTHFWQEDWFAAGFREFPHSSGDEYYIDVDAGPVFQGYGTSATAFGIGAARVNGHFDHASTLSYQAVAASWPLPNGTMLFPRLFSNAEHAPYLGEVSILFQLTREPVNPGISQYHSGRMTGVVWVMLGIYAVLAWVTCWPGWRLARSRGRYVKR